MNLDDAVEQSLRNLYGAIVRRDLEGVLAGLDDLAEGDPLAAIDMADKILTATVWSLFDHRFPSGDEARVLARQAHEEGASWVEDLPTVDEFVSVLELVGRETGVPSVDLGDALVVAAFTTAYLLTHDPAGWPWNDLLDLVEDRIERSQATPD